jgi:hypothetical protein
MPRSTNWLRGPAVSLGLLVVAAGISGCGYGSAPSTSPPPTPAEPPEPSACVVTREDSATKDTIAIALAESVDSAHAPLPSNDAERLLFRQRYVSPIRLDCEGGVHSGLATSWTRDSSGRSWTLVLRSDTPALDGEPLTAGRLAAEWRSRETAATTLQWAGVESVLPLDPQRLVVTWARPQESIPEVLADPALAMAVRGGRANYTFVPVSASGGDLRDALDRGADVVQSGDPALVEYAKSRADRLIVPLPWDKTYVLLLPAGSNGLDSIISTDSAAFRSALARDAVHGDSRGAEPPFWWVSEADCARPTPASRPAAQPSGAVVYTRDDRIARDLAERIVALAAAPGITSRGLSAADLLGSLQVGRERGYVLALPRRTAVPCRELASWPSGASVLPLVDTRLTAIVGRDLPRVTVDWDGALRIGDHDTEGKQPR